MARETDRFSGETKKTCRCCGYQIERENLPISCNLDELKFLGSGFPLFYNYIKYCLLILSVLFLTTSIYNIVTNAVYGHFCQPSDEKEAVHSDAHHKNLIETFQNDLGRAAFMNLEEKKNNEASADSEHSHGCYLNWMSMLSLPNKKDNKEYMMIQETLNLVAGILIMIILLFFRKSQRDLNDLVDSETNSPSDYSILVKNIPTFRGVDYQKEIKNFFETKISLEKTFNVTKVCLLYDMEEVEEIENEIKNKVKSKQQCMRNGYDLKEIEEEIEKLEHKLKETKFKIEKDPMAFEGMAIVSFRTEDGEFFKLYTNS